MRLLHTTVISVHLLSASGCLTTGFWEAATKPVTYFPQTRWLGVIPDGDRADLLYFERGRITYYLSVPRNWPERPTLENAIGRVQLQEPLQLNPMEGPASNGEMKPVYTIWDEVDASELQYASFSPEDSSVSIYGADGKQTDWILLAHVSAGDRKVWEPGPGHYTMAVLVTPLTLVLDVGTVGLFFLLNPEAGLHLAALIAQAAGAGVR